MSGWFDSDPGFKGVESNMVGILIFTNKHESIISMTVIIERFALIGQSE